MKIKLKQYPALSSSGINVLSLFDGISCGMLALQKLNIPVLNYCSYEIEEKALQVSQHHFPDIIRRGSVTETDFTQYINVDLLLGGSPCQDLSSAKQNREGLQGARSSLFFNYVEALNNVKPTYFLFENVASMSNADKDIITSYLKVSPKLIDSADFSAGTRKRLYWTNIPNVKSRPATPNTQVLQDILQPVSEIPQDDWRPSIEFEYLGANKPVEALKKNGTTFRNNVELRNPRFKAPTLVKSGSPFSLLQNNTVRYATMLEYERLQTLPDNYTAIIKSKRFRQEVIGNGWTVDTIAYILSHIPFQKN